MVGAARKLRQIVHGLDPNELQETCAEKGIQWMFTTPAAPHLNGCVGALFKSCKGALKKANKF